MSEGRTREFHIRQFADLRAEGVGSLHGHFFLWGTVVLKASGLIHVSMKGWTGAMEIARRHAGTVAWWGGACLVRSLAEGSTMWRGSTIRLERGGVEVWSNTMRNGRSYSPIGACLLKIPDNEDPSQYMVSIRGGYRYNGIPPFPAVASDMIEVPAIIGVS